MTARRSALESAIEFLEIPAGMRGVKKWQKIFLSAFFFKRLFHPTTGCEKYFGVTIV